MNKLAFVIGVAALSTTTSAFADSKKFAVGVNGGTRGLGVDAVVGLGKFFNVRGTYSQYDFDESYEEDGINYDGTLELKTMGALLDYYPFAGSFRLSAGYLNNGSDLRARAVDSDGVIMVGDNEYDISNEWVQSDLDWDSTAPYLGLGWGNSLGKGSNWTFTLDLGIIFTGKPDARLTASDGLMAQDGFQEDLAREEAALQDEIDDFDQFPVLQLGFTYAF